MLARGGFSKAELRPPRRDLQGRRAALPPAAPPGSCSLPAPRAAPPAPPPSSAAVRRAGWTRAGLGKLFPPGGQGLPRAWSPRDTPARRSSAGRPLNSWASEAGAASGPQRPGGVPSPAPPANQDPRGPCPASGVASSRRQPWVSAQRREPRGARPPSPPAPRVRAPAARTGLMARAGAPGAGGGRGRRRAPRSCGSRAPTCLARAAVRP